MLSWFLLRPSFKFFPPPVAIRQYFRKKLKKDKAVIVCGMIDLWNEVCLRKLIQRLIQNLIVLGVALLPSTQDGSFPGSRTAEA
jgi:hypothetical protein